jgi:hypothetical protein
LSGQIGILYVGSGHCFLSRLYLRGVPNLVIPTRVPSGRDSRRDFPTLRTVYVWLFHLHGFFICMRFSLVWVLPVGFARGFCPWVLLVGFARGFCPWVLPVGFARGFCSWISSVGFHLSFLRSMRAEYTNEVCERSMRAEYASEVCERSIFWWDEHYTNILLQYKASLHHYITSSHVFFKFHVFFIFISLSSLFNKKKIFKAYELFIKTLRYTSFDEKNIFSRCKSTVEYVSLGLLSGQFFSILAVARELVFFKTSELSKHTIV